MKSPKRSRRRAKKKKKQKRDKTFLVCVRTCARAETEEEGGKRDFGLEKGRGDAAKEVL